MKHFFVMMFLITSASLYAQQGKNQFQIAGQVGFPTGDFADAVQTGYGGTVKGLLGLGKNLQGTFMTGYSIYKAKIQANAPSASTNFKSIPLLLGARANLGDFFIEPQVGWSINTITARAGGASASETQGSFTWNAGIGYKFDNLELGVRYQYGRLKNSDENFTYAGVHLGYNFDL